MRFGRIICMSAIATCVAFSSFAQGLPKANKPEDVGFSSERLKRVTDVFQSEVDKGAIPGAVVLIARNRKIAYLEAFGFQDRENKKPMTTDAIFRIASMSKPITSVAVMMLVEEGKIQLLDPVSHYLTEFKGVQVGVEKLNTTTGNSELIGEPPRQEMTIQDLLRHTWSSVRAAKSFEAGSAIAKDAAAAEIDSTAIRLGHFISCSYCQALTDQESNVRCFPAGTGSRTAARTTPGPAESSA